MPEIAIWRDVLLTPEIIILITISISLIGIVISLSDKEDKVN